MTPRPCPFCGSLPAIETIHRNGVRLPGFIVRCVNGYCEIRPRLGPHWNSMESTVGIWNERRRTPKT